MTTIFAIFYWLSVAITLDMAIAWFKQRIQDEKRICLLQVLIALMVVFLPILNTITILIIIVTFLEEVSAEELEEHSTIFKFLFKPLNKVLKYEENCK